MHAVLRLKYSIKWLNENTNCLDPENWMRLRIFWNSDGSNGGSGYARPIPPAAGAAATCCSGAAEPGGGAATESWVSQGSSDQFIQSHLSYPWRLRCLCPHQHYA